MKIFAHRGFSGKYPENTMLAFEKAKAIGAHGIELDVHLSKDGKPVIIHDELLKRTTGREGSVHDYLFDELITINAGKTFDDKYGHTPIPSFEEYCDFIRKTDIVTNIEIKTNQFYYPRIEEIVADMIRMHNLKDKVIISSFNWLSIVRMKAIWGELTCGLLQETSLLQNAGTLASTCGIECYHPDIRLMNDSIVDDCRKHGIGLNLWTINTKEQFEKCLAWGVDSAITNYPDLGLSLL